MSGGDRVGAVILAAGASRRFGSPKQLVVVDGRTLPGHAIDAAMAAGLAPVVAVVPVWLGRPARPDDPRLRWVRNPFPERGMSLSLRLGFDALGDEADAAVILLGDQPGLPPESIRALLAARGDRPVVASVVDGILAPPILVERSHFRLVSGPSGDVGLREILVADPDLVTAVSVTDRPLDLDTPDDLARVTRP
jgi:molybdenum cofactor cytidylyltransferase